MGEGLAVVILAAGLGKRMHSRLPKVLHPLLGRPMIGHVLDAAAALRPRSIAVVTGHGGAEVQAWVDGWADSDGARQGVAPRCAVQPHQGGTGHAVWCAESLWRDSSEVIVLYGDTPLLTAATLQELCARRQGGLVSLLVGELADPTGYGRVILGGDGRISRIVEHKDAEPDQKAVRLVNAGMMCVATEFLAASLPRLRPDNAQGELYLTDVLAMAAKAGQPAAPFILSDPTEVQGVNNRAELARATAHLRDRINLAWMQAGVTFDDPASAIVEAGVSLEPDCRIGAAVELRGATTVATGAAVERGCVVTDCAIEAGAHLLPYTVATEAHIGAGAHVGPFAHLRPGTVLDARVKIGNFVETKKARLREGAKASHLSYLGDADIGPDCNIGAGTITCNYDGVAKHRTVLGRGVFIGSDSQLVAPVTLGDEAYVGAGTTVTADVPAGALVVTRIAAVVKAGWVAKKRAQRAAAAARPGPA